MLIVHHLFECRDDLLQRFGSVLIDFPQSTNLLIEQRLLDVLLRNGGLGPRISKQIHLPNYRNYMLMLSILS